MVVSTKKLKKFVTRAKKLKNLCGHKCRHVSFLIKKNKILGVGVNSKKTDAFAFRNGYVYGSTHSELAALKAAMASYTSQEVEGSVLINIRIGRADDSCLLSRPCPACLRLARTFGIAKIYFTNEVGDFSITN